MTEKLYNAKVLKEQLRALHDIAHHRLMKDLLDGRTTDGLCTCNLMQNQGHWFDYACPIDRLCKTLFDLEHPSQSFGQYDNTNRYLRTLRHPDYKPELLEQQLRLVCQTLRGKDKKPKDELNAQNTGFCYTATCSCCPVSEIYKVMADVRFTDANNLDGGPTNEWHKDHRINLPVRIKLTNFIHTAQIVFLDIELQLSQKRAFNFNDDTIANWADTFLNKTTARVIDSGSYAKPDDTIVECCGENKQRFTINIPAELIAGKSTSESFASRIISSHFQNIKTWKIKKEV